MTTKKKLPFLSTIVAMITILSPMVASQSFFELAVDNVLVERSDTAIYRRGDTYEIVLIDDDAVFFSLKYSESGFYSADVAVPNSVGKLETLTVSFTTPDPVGYYGVSSVDVTKELEPTITVDRVRENFARRRGDAVSHSQIIYDDQIYEYYVVSMPHGGASSVLLYAEEGSVSFQVDGEKTSYEFDGEVIRAVQDFGLIMSVNGLR